MDEKKTLSERLENDILSDNTQFQKCEQCKDCMFWNGGTAYSNDYRKSSCRIYPYPKFKPLEVISGDARCEFYEKEKH